MNKPEFYGDDQQEHMLTALSRITYHMKRGKNESWREFYSRWDVALRRVHDHKISLQEEYEGFLMINGLQLTEMETKNMLNFTHGCIRPRSIKEWLRKNETKLSASELGADKKKTNTNYHTEIEAHALEEEGEPTESWNDPEIEELELYINDLLDPEETAEDDILEENEAAEILNTILQKKKTYTQSLKSKKEKELSRGYGFSKGGGKGKSFSWPRGGQYRVSGNMTIEEIKRRTRCRNCQEIGHWKRECPNPPKPRQFDGKKTNEAHYLAETNEAIFVGLMESDHGASSSNAVVSEFPTDPKSGSVLSTKPRDESEYHAAYTASDQIGPNTCDHLFVFENWFCEMVKNSNGISIQEETCATVDTGCQRLAIGSIWLTYPPNWMWHCTLRPTGLRVFIKFQLLPGWLQFHVLWVPRAASFVQQLDCEQSEQAPFLISLILSYFTVIPNWDSANRTGFISGFEVVKKFYHYTWDLQAHWESHYSSLTTRRSTYYTRHRKKFEKDLKKSSKSWTSILSMPRVLRAWQTKHPLRPWLLPRPLHPVEHSAKRARGSGDVENKATRSWARMFLKIFKVMFPIYDMMARVMAPKQNHKHWVSRMINSMGMEELLYTREYVNLQIRKMELEMDNQDKETYSLVTDTQQDLKKIEEEEERASTTPTSWSRVTPTPKTPSASPSVTSTIITQGRTEEKIGDVPGLEQTFGEIPTCYCGMVARLHLSLKEGRNFEKTFFRCPRPVGRQCRYFKWTTYQPYHDEANFKYKQGQPLDWTYADVMRSVVQEQCPHRVTTRAGTNGYVNRESCVACKKELKVEKKNPVAKEQKGHKNAPDPDFEEYQKFREWQRQQKWAAILKSFRRRQHGR